MSELNEYKKIVQSIVNRTQPINEDEQHTPESYLQKHLLEIQDKLDDEIVSREKFERIIKLIFCQCANYTLSMFLINLGMAIWISTLIGLFIGLTPGVEALLLAAKTKDDSLGKYLPVAVKIGVGLFTSTVVVTSVTVPQLASQNTVKKVYQEIETVEYGNPQNSGLSNLHNSPTMPLIIAVGLAVIYINLRKK
ncbi:MAG TPA: hypothetical protein DCE56_18945 [Cyanobacteria bacterium UBA8553]|nr:hypothetical protein [Cyanobacteria bacterium UBA8553]HAJ63727.1 hypothetical protein [Cyanobacteria bacterium UBA8543]